MTGCNPCASWCIRRKHYDYEASMKNLFAAVSALVISAGLVGSAQAHPHHHGHTAPAPVWVQLEPEIVATFEAGGETYTVVNTHNRGLFGFELINIKNSTDRTVSSWWTTRGWCFTTQSYDANACYTRSGYAKFFTAKLNGPVFNVADGFSGGSSSGSSEFCDHYTKLEAEVSRDADNPCDYELRDLTD